MKYFVIFPYYLSWHYGRGYHELFNTLKNFIIFIPTFFSIGTLLKTLFSPLYKMKERYEGGFDIGNLMEVTVVNLIMRVVGFIVRTVVIIAGFIASVVTVVFSFSLIIVWSVIPFAVSLAFVVSLISIFNNLL